MDVALPRAFAAVRRSGVRTPSILLWMALAIAVVTALAYWDEDRESQAALDDFAAEQTTVAASLAASLGQRVRVPGADALASPAELLGAIDAVERPSAVRVLLARPDGVLLARDGSAVRSSAVEGAVQAGATSLRLGREDAVALGLPRRTALVGLGAAETPSGRYTIAVLATAQVVRDREQRARWRLVLGVLLASGLVLAFGGLAMRTQRKELELSHALDLQVVRNERDERLVRADKLATMGALATGIAHEVSTPLGVILGRAEQILLKQPDERARRAVETIVQQSDRISAVIRGFLALARGAQPALEHCEPGALARAAVELVEHRFEKARVRLHADVPASLPPVPVDPRLFEQVLVNLLLNACDACGENGEVVLQLRAVPDRVVFSVTDDGVGISADVAERATEPFFTTKPEGKGTGLGLAIANEIVKHHCGSLQLFARRDRRGTEASVEVPIARDDANG
jgi:signal transduction histidine kinase